MCREAEVERLERVLNEYKDAERRALRAYGAALREIKPLREALRSLVGHIKADRAESRYPDAIAYAEKALRGESDDE